MKLKKTIAMVLTAAMLMGSVSDSLAAVLELPQSVTVIEEEAFAGDESLDEVVLPEGIERIESRAFADSSVSQIHFPESLSYIADDAFENTPDPFFTAEGGSYAAQWIEDHTRVLYFDSPDRDDLTVDMAIFEPNEETGLQADPFACYFSLADVQEWSERLEGMPEWSVTQIDGPESSYFFAEAGPYAGSLCVEMPDLPARTTYEVTCTWGWQSMSARVTVNYVIPETLPESTNIANCYILKPYEENVISLSFEPEYLFGNMDRVGLECYSGEADYYFDGHDLHITPYGEGNFTGFIALYSGNMYIQKTVAFRVMDVSDELDITAVASWRDIFTVTWNPIESDDGYIVSAYLDEECTQLYDSTGVADPFIFFQTDVGTRYWFKVECTVRGELIRSEAVTADPIEPLPAPENLTLTLTETGHVIPSWDPIPDALGYRVYSSVTSSEWALDTDWFSFMGTQEEADFDGLWVDYGETLYVWVCVDNGDGPNARSFAQITRTDGQLHAPENLTLILMDDGHVRPVWDAVPGATGYRIYSSITTDMWAPDLDWFSFEGAPEDVDYETLWIDEGETLYVWVCADEGEDPNELAFDQVTRLPQATLLADTELSLIPLLNPEDAIDEEDAAFIAGYNEIAADINAHLSEYIAGIQSFHDSVAGLKQIYQSASVDEDYDAVNYTINGFTLRMDRNVVRALKGNVEISNVSMSDSGNVAILEGNGTVFYAHVSDDMIYVTDTPPAVSNRVLLRGIVSSPALEKFISTVSSLANAYNAVKKYLDFCIDRAEYYKYGKQRVYDHWRKYARTAEETAKLEKARRELDKMLRIRDGFVRASKVLDYLNIGGQIASAYQIITRWQRILEIQSHGHPTEFDNTPEAIDDSDLLRDDIRSLNSFYTFDSMANVVALYSAVCGVLSGVGAPPAMIIIGADIAINLAASTWTDRIYREIIDTDKKLHTVIYGFVKDKDTNLPLEHVAVIAGSNAVFTDEAGYYEINLRADDNQVAFRLEKYKPNGFVVTINPGQTIQKDMYLTAIENNGYITGTVTNDVTNELMAGVTVTCDDLQTSTAEDGTFTFTVEPGDYTVSFQMDGFDPDSANVTVIKDETSEVPMRLHPETGYVVGTVTNTEGETLSNITVRCDEYSTQTDEQGRYLLELPIGEKTLSFSGNCYPRLDRQKNVTAHQEVTCDAVLSSTIIYHLTLKDQNGAPVDNVPINIVSYATYDERKYYSPVTDENGEVRIQVAYRKLEVSFSTQTIDYPDGKPHYRFIPLDMVDNYGQGFYATHDYDEPGPILEDEFTVLNVEDKYVNHCYVDYDWPVNNSHQTDDETVDFYWNGNHVHNRSREYGRAYFFIVADQNGEYAVQVQGHVRITVGVDGVLYGAERDVTVLLYRGILGNAVRIRGGGSYPASLKPIE